MDESYTLDIAAMAASLRAPSVWGALRGLETFAQLVDTRKGRRLVKEASVRDAPRCGYRHAHAY
eukprot:7322761-Pyramimonas_sp.AAC.1